MERIQHAVDVARLQRSSTVSEPVRLTPPHPVRASTGETSFDWSQLQRITVDPALSLRRPIVFAGDRSPAAQAYRMLRTQLLHRIRQLRLRTIGVVSAADREGKSLTAVNLAFSLAAEPNQSVLLADLDLRRPGIAALLELPVERGLDAWLLSDAALSDVCYQIAGTERLALLPTLAAVQGSSEVLAGSRMQDLFAQLKSGPADRLLLFDLPPVLLTDDFLTIAPQLDGVLLVAREGRTRRDDLQRVQELLGSVPLLGTVLNDSAQSEQRVY